MIMSQMEYILNTYDYTTQFFTQIMLNIAHKAETDRFRIY